MLAYFLLSLGCCDTANSQKPSQAGNVQLPPGETMLADVGLYRVFWQANGQQAVEMPDSWSGNFELKSGISFQDKGRVLDRRALLMHPPWRDFPGKTWVDYRFKLPKLKPIRLKFDIAVNEYAAESDRGDGVTFSCFLYVAGRRQELMREHHANSKWRGFDFDLSQYAGEVIGIRLQVEPGPQNDAAFDFALFGDAKISVGTSEQLQRELLQRLTGSKAYQATKNADLTKLSNRDDQGVVPGNLLPYRNDLEKSGNSWQFSYRGEDCDVVYEWTPKTGTLDDFRVQVDGGKSIAPAYGGGVFAAIDQDNSSADNRLLGGKALKVRRDQDVLKVLWEYELPGQKVRVDWSYSISGKALLISARCDQPLLSQLSLGDVGLTALRKDYSIPYLAGTIKFLPVQDLFACRYLDWTKSHGSSCPQGVANYATKTDGTRNCLDETGYISVSSDLREVLPNIPLAPSQFRELLAPRIVLDVWDHHQGTLQGDAANLEALKDHGVDHLAIILHNWQRFGYDVKLPDHLPANPEFGGDDGMVAFGKTANRLNYLWSLHENYIDLYPDAPSYDATARVLNSNGSPALAWFNQSTQVQSFGLKCNRSLGYAKQNSPEIHRRYATSAAYLDVHTCVPPWHLLDHEADQSLAAMSIAKVKFDSELFEFMRNVHQGPLLGEGRNHFYWAGRCDGVEAEIAGGEDHQPLLDFDLLKIHPQMVNHGMGYFERWFRAGYEIRWGRDAGSMEQMDKYRAQQLAYGHAGFVGGAQVDNLHRVIREHHLMHPVQRMFAVSRPVEISYELDGQFVTASAALVAGDTSRQRIRYENGLNIWVNWRDKQWIVEERELPQWGYLALGPDTEVCMTLRDGKWSDYAECKDYIFADSRNYSPQSETEQPTDIQPSLRTFKHLGGNRAQITYQWQVNEDLDQNYQCFVHGVHKNGRDHESIEFQKDHELTKRTRGWRKGDVIIDGPHEFIVSNKYDEYDMRIGLYQRDKRLELKGARDAENRILVAKLRLERLSDGRISKIIAEKVVPQQQPDSKFPAADFTAHLNPSGTRVEFGKVATNGSFKLEFKSGQLILFPYPRNQRFQVSLDLKQLAPQADRTQVKVTALATGTQKSLGAADFAWEDDRLVIKVGMPEAGRYVVTWD